jgi:phospho-N-acetylmuramoyl-pentapeptide-transferase
VVRTEGPQTHLGKSGTPTMGGVIIVLATVIPTLLWARLDSMNTWAVLVTLCWLGGLGFMDDYLKITRKKTEGLKGRYKLIGQTAAGLLLGVALVVVPMIAHQADLGVPTYPFAWTQIPFFKTVHLTLWWPLYILFVTFIIVGCSNAVNLTDGLDGLAAGTAAMVLATYVIIGFWQFRNSCALSGVAGCYQVRDPLDVALVASSAMGACIGFLWWNAAPARIFMGDTGSLALGGLVAGLSIVTRTELLLVVIGGVFVVETLSVALQIVVFRTTRKRLFRMAPFHHHFELAGWAETTVIIRFWLLAAMCAALGLGLFYSEWLTASSGVAS